MIRRDADRFFAAPPTEELVDETVRLVADYGDDRVLDDVAGTATPFGRGISTDSHVRLALLEADERLHGYHEVASVRLPEFLQRLFLP